MATRRAIVDRTDLVVKPGDAVVLGPDAQLPVAAFGDSLMWGQGLKRGDRFSVLFTSGLAKQTGQTSQLVFDKSRSGAQIDGTSGERVQFTRTYPALVTGRDVKKKFLESGDESAASALYGEVPSTFPSIRGQVQMMADTLGAKIAVALLDGGVNDVEIKEIVDPRAGSGEFISRFDGHIKTVAYDDVLDLIRRVRGKCPKAVIMYFGFFEAMSYDSDTAKIKAFLKREFDNDLKWFLNEHVISVEDVNGLIAEAIVRTVWFQSRWQYWTSKAVDDANHNDDLRGPGVVYVPSGIVRDHAVFAGAPWLWDDTTDPTNDDAQATRVARIPRSRHLREMDTLRAALVNFVGSGPAAAMPAARTLLAKIDGPLPLRDALRKFGGGDSGQLGDLFRELSAEISRIRHGRIASLSHPNRAGAKSYATIALARHQELMDRQAQARKETSLGAPPLIPAGVETLDQLLTRCNLRGTGPLVADLARLHVDSIRLRIVTSPDSSDHFIPDVWLVVTTRNNSGTAAQHEYMVNFKYRSFPLGSRVQVIKLYPQFEPGTTHRFTIATAGDIRLDEVVGTALIIGADPYAGKSKTGYGTKWIPETVQIEVNGVPVHDIAVQGVVYRPGNHLDLQWPAPQPNFQPPKLKTVSLKQVSDLGLKAPTPSAVVTPADTRRARSPRTRSPG